MHSSPDPQGYERARSAALQSFAMLDAPAEQEFDEIAKLAADICGTPMAVVNLVDTERQFFLAETGLGVRSTPLETSFCLHALLTEDLLVVEDAYLDPRFSGNPLVTVEGGLRFYAGALLKSDDGFPIGTLCVLDRKVRKLNRMQLDALRILARQIMQQLNLRKALREATEVAALRKMLAAESAHRVKNLLAIVQSLVSQTLRNADSPQDAAETVSGRLNAMARAQDLLVAAETEASAVEDIVRNALSAHEVDDRMTIGGDDASLEPQQALALALGIHELATNAVKYGALSGDEGTIRVTWSADRGRLTRFDWVEQGGNGEGEPDRRGFGSQLLERYLASVFEGGEARLSWRPEGVAYSLEISPAS